MKRSLIVLFVALSILIVLGATPGCNCVARTMGGSCTVTLQKGQRLSAVTWKDGDSLWILTRPRTPEERPVVWTFREDSNLGVMEGSVTLKEQ